MSEQAALARVVCVFLIAHHQTGLPKDHFPILIRTGEAIGRAGGGPLCGGDLSSGGVSSGGAVGALRARISHATGRDRERGESVGSPQRPQADHRCECMSCK